VTNHVFPFSSELWILKVARSFSHEILGNHRQQSQQSRLGLYFSESIPTGEQSGLQTHIAATGDVT
jgi:hypothetical protein